MPATAIKSQDAVTDTSTLKQKTMGKEKDSEKWDKFDVNKWRAAMFSTRGYFKQLYEDTPEFVRRIIAEHKKLPYFANKKVRLIEVGSGTGEFLFALANDVETIIGVEFNDKFVNFCEERRLADYHTKDMKFVLGDAQQLVNVLEETGTGGKEDELVIIACVNNTFGIMPPEMRANVYKQIYETLKLLPDNTLLLGGYWDGNHFGNSVQHFYGDNPVLCGDLKDAKIDWENNIMTTTSGYRTQWTTPNQAYDTMTSYGFEVTRIEARSRGVLALSCLPGSQASRVQRCETRGLTTSSETVSQDYYDSDAAFDFYTNVWGGDNIHIGVYDECATLGVTDKVEQVRLASIRVLELLSSKVDIRNDWNVMDMGSALGGCSRYLAQNYGCSVLGVDLSVKECEVNVKKTTRAGLDHLVRVKCCSFTDTGEEAESYDLVVSEDSFLHAGQYRADAIKEAARILKPGGFLVFTDPMEADDVDKSKLSQIYNRIHLEDMGSVKFYKQVAKENGLNFVEFDQMTEHLVTHYATVQEILRLKKDELLASTKISEEYVSNMDKGLSYWVDGGNAGLLNYGIFVFQKPPASIEDLAQAAAKAAQAAMQCAQLAEKLAKASCE